MNTSAAVLRDTIPTECVMYKLLRGKLDDTTSEAYAVLVFLVAISIITSPVTISLNVLVIVAVGTKARLKTNSNILLACLAVTDGLVGVIGQPMFIATRSLTLQGDMSYQYCILDQSTRNAIRFLCAASIAHMVSMNMERYFALKHPFTNTAMVTKARVLVLSALAWTATIPATIPAMITDKRIYLTTSNISIAICLGFITFCQVTIYSVIRRHEKQIAAQQISAEARRNFLKEKKALKITTCVVMVLFLCYLPILVVRILLVTSAITSKNTAYICFYAATFITVSNSFINPLIYCIRMRPFRVAFIELLLRKNYTQAEQFETRLFGRSNIEAPTGTAKEGEQTPQNGDNEGNGMD